MQMLDIGSIVDERYEIRAPLGAGGFGTVYKAWQQQFERNVAFKILNTNVLEEPDGALRFEREAKSISALRHKNIVSFYGFGIWNQAPYMVMELVEGTSLYQELLRDRRLSPNRAAGLVQQICEALASAHQHGIVHRDLKPANIMIIRTPGFTDTIKIIDFGLAKLMPGYGIAAQKLTESGFAIGTCHYMSPEQCVGNEAVDHRADIYAAGCILYECLTGKPPFEADENVAIMFKHLNEHPKPLAELIPDNPETQALQAIIDRAMAKAPAERYESASAMADDLNQVFNGEFRGLTPTNQRAGKQRARWVVSSLTTVVAAASVGAGVTAWFMMSAANHAPSADAPPDSITAHHHVKRLVDPTNWDGVPSAEIAEWATKSLQADMIDHRLGTGQRMDMMRHLQNWAVHSKNYALAENTARKTIELASDGSTWVDYFTLGRCAELQGNFAEARRYYREIVERSDDRHYNAEGREKGRIYLARIMVKTGERDRAMSTLRSIPEGFVVIKLAPAYYQTMGVLELIRKHYPEAKQSFIKGNEFARDKLKCESLLGLARCALLTNDMRAIAKLRGQITNANVQGDFHAVRNASLLQIALAAKQKDTGAVQALTESLVVLKPDSEEEFDDLNELDAKLCVKALREGGYSNEQARLRTAFQWGHWGH
jgi:serine/threonine protein kinase